MGYLHAAYIFTWAVLIGYIAVLARGFRRLQEDMRRSVWASGCHSWYQTKSGKVTAIWPGFTFSFRKRTRRVRAHDYRFVR